MNSNPPEKSFHSAEQASGSQQKFWFLLLFLYLIVDLGRIQDHLSIAFLRPGLIISAGLACFLFIQGQFWLHIKQIRLLYLFLMLLLIHVPLAVNNYYAFQTARAFFIFLIFILAVVSLLDSTEKIKKFLNMWIGITLYISIFAIFNLGKGSGGWFADENDLSLYLNTMLPFCFFLFLIENKFWKRALYIATALASLIAEVISFSRGGFVGLAAMFVFMILFSKKKILTLIFVSLIGIGVFYYGGEAYRNEMETITETQSGTAQARLQYWKAAWRMFIDNPFGVGGNNFQVRFPEYQSDWFGRGMWGRVAHSLWFTLIPELGIFGIFIYFSLLFHNIKDLLMLRSMETGGDSDLKFLSMIATATLVSLAGFFTSAAFLSVLYYPFYWYLTALIVSLCRVSSIIKTTNEMKDSNLAINESHSLV